MQGTVTAIGSYNGAPCFEYEIRDDANNLMVVNGKPAVDIVIIHPVGTETWDELAELIGDIFLRKRVAKWALSNTREMQSRRRELITGGKRLSEYPMAGAAPRVRSTTPAARHRVSTTMTVAQAEALRDVDLSSADLTGIDEETRVRASKAFEV